MTNILAMTLDRNSVPGKDMFVSTSVVLICFTVFVQGTTSIHFFHISFWSTRILVRPLVKFLRVQTKSDEREHKLETYTDVFVTTVRIYALKIKWKLKIEKANQIKICLE